MKQYSRFDKPEDDFKWFEGDLLTRIVQGIFYLVAAFLVMFGSQFIIGAIKYFINQ